MSKSFIGVAAVLVVVAVAGYLVFFTNGSSLDQEGKAFVDRALPDVLGHLSRETLAKYASQDLFDTTSPEEFDKIFAWLKKLGALKEYRGATGQAGKSSPARGGDEALGRYSAQAVFDSGPATVDVTAVKRKNQWYIKMFWINSSVLLGQ